MSQINPGIKKAITEIVELKNSTEEEVLQKARTIQHIWRLRTLEDGVVFLLDMARFERDVADACC